MIKLTLEQAQQIEEALVSQWMPGNDAQEQAHDKALATIRAARAHEQAEQEQEPMAWVWLDEWLNDGYPEDCFSRVNHQNKTPLYAAPLRTKDLTNDEIRKLWDDAELDITWFARAIIATDWELNR